MFRNRDIKLILNSYKIYIQCIHIQKKNIIRTLSQHIEINIVLE